MLPQVAWATVWHTQYAVWHAFNELSCPESESSSEQWLCNGVVVQEC